MRGMCRESWETAVLMDEDMALGDCWISCGIDDLLREHRIVTLIIFI